MTDAYRFALGPQGLAFASPQVALVAAFGLAYGLGLALGGKQIGSHLPLIGLAVIAGVASLLVGIALVWGRPTRPDSLPRPSPTSLLLPYLGLLLVVIGVVCLGAYLWRIGAVPLLMSSAESGRVAAAERGGAALRVLSLLALPGVWILVGWAASGGRRPVLLGSILLVLVIALLQVLTGNRSPAFQTLVVSAVVGLLSAGVQRFRAPGLALAAAFAIALVLSAGFVGAIRLGSSVYLGPPLPGESDLPGPPRNYLALTAIAIRGYAVVPVQNFAYTVDAVPEVIGWRFGYTYVQPLVTVLPGKQATFDQDLKAALGQSYAGGGTVPSLLGESYANFGPAGWVLVPLMMGATATWLYGVAMRAQSPAVWTLYGFALVHLAGSVVSGLFVASVFPYVAYGVLGATAVLDLRSSRRSPVVAD